MSESTPSRGDARRRIVVAGGGFAGARAALLLDAALEHVADVTLVSDGPYLDLKPRALRPGEAAHHVRLARLQQHSTLQRVEDRIESIDVRRQVVRCASTAIDYDFLVLATGSRLDPGAIPGLTATAVPYWQPGIAAGLLPKVEALLAQPRDGRLRILFGICPGNATPDPIYNMLAMVHQRLHGAGQRSAVELVLATPERYLCELFSTDDAIEAAPWVAPMLDELHTTVSVESVSEGCLCADDGSRLTFDVLVAAPPQVPALRVPALRSDPRGFVVAQEDSCQVAGYPEIYVVGDMRSATPRQAYRALNDAGRVVSHLCSRLAGDQPGVVAQRSRRLLEELAVGGGFPNETHWWN